jgi:hypothetical protein
MFRKLAVQITERSVVNVYTDITCSIDDRLVIETKGGLVMAQVVDISEPIDYNPFERGNAKWSSMEHVMSVYTYTTLLSVICTASFRNM